MSAMYKNSSGSNFVFFSLLCLLFTFGSSLTHDASSPQRLLVGFERIPWFVKFSECCLHRLNDSTGELNKSNLHRMEQSFSGLFKEFWISSGDFLQYQWTRVLRVCDHDETKVLFLGLYILPYLNILLGSCIYGFMDFTGWPKCLRVYKVQPGTNEPLDFKKFMKVVKVVHFNVLGLGLPSVFVLHKIREYLGHDDIETLPSFPRFLMHIVCFALSFEIASYYNHRILHHRLLYKHIHKIHHEWQSPIAPVGFYCHPIEYIMLTITPSSIGTLIFGTHIFTTIFFLQYGIMVSLTEHSNYHLPFMISSEFHDYHHLKFNQCFGVLGIMDYLHGTDKKFRMSKEFQRHRMILTTVPPRVLIPDEGDEDRQNRKTN